MHSTALPHARALETRTAAWRAHRHDTETRTARAIMDDHPDLSRSDALRLAATLCAKGADARVARERVR